MRAEEVSHWYKASPYYRRFVVSRWFPRPRASITFWIRELTSCARPSGAKTIMEDHRGIILMWIGLWTVNSDVNRSVPAEEIRNAGWIPSRSSTSSIHTGEKTSIIEFWQAIQDEKLGDDYFSQSAGCSRNPTKITAIPLPI